MAVYTEVSDQELTAFLRGYDIGRAMSLQGITEGVENSNYLLRTDQDSFILTLYEKRVVLEDLMVSCITYRRRSDALPHRGVVAGGVNGDQVVL